MTIPGAARFVTAVGFAVAAVAVALVAHFSVALAPISSQTASPPCNAGYDLDVYNLECIPEITVGPPSQELLTVCSGGSRNDCVRQNFYSTSGLPWVDVPDVGSGAS